MKYNTVILGAGAIAGGYDEPTSVEVLTHAHAYMQNSCTTLLGFYDIQFDVAQNMAKKWRVNAFKSLDELQSVDIVSICTPDKCHYSSIYDALVLKPKLIFLEKPAGTNKNEIDSILQISQRTPIQVNYSRRFVPEIQKLARRIQSNALGKFFTGHGFYGKGYWHNGSHLRDLLEFLLGRIVSTQHFAKVADFYEHDPTQDVFLTFEQGSFYMQGVHCRIATLFELDLIFENCRIRILNGGMQIEEYTIQENSLYAGYNNFSLNTTYATQGNFALKVAVQNIVDFLEDKATLLSPMRDFQ